MGTKDIQPEEIQPGEANPERNPPQAGNREQPESSAQEAVEQAASYLRELLAGLASRLRPFPAFLGMVSLQAIELDPLPDPPDDLGCVVVLPGGEICQLDLKVLPGIEGVQDIDPVEEFTELDLTPEDYIIYAASAVRLIYRELRRREG